MATNILTPSIVESVDALASTATTYTLAVGQTAQGVLSSYSDQDWYRVNLTAGQVYSFAVIGTGSTPLTDTYLYLENASGVQLASNNDGGPHASSIITYTALTSGTYYLNIANNWTVSGQYGAGQYGLSVTTGTKPNFDFSMGAGAVDAHTSWANSTGTTGSTVVTYGFRDTAATYTEPGSNIASFTRLTSAEISAVNLALKLWSDVAGIQFVQVNPGGYTNNATILLGNYSDSTDGAGAFALYPGSTVASSSSGDVWLNTANGISQTNANVGTYTFQTILHELGHAIGLSHPGDYNATPGVTFSYANSAQFLQDSEQYSVMSYFGATSTGGAIPTNDIGSPLMLDILALQNIYGANMATRTGDTTYGFGSNAGSPYAFASNSAPQFCIWDAGGIDTLNCSSYSQNQTINLGAGTFSDIGGYKANISIAMNVTIENAVGGSGDDIITGNSADNVLTGNGGNDTLIGGGGVDTATYAGYFYNYIFSFFTSDGHLQVQDKVLARDGTDSLYAISNLRFADLTALQSTVGGSGAYQDTLSTSCSTATLVSNLDAFAALCNAGELGAISRADSNPWSLSAQVVGSDSKALAKVSSLANLVLSDSAANLNNVDLSNLGAGQVLSLKPTTLDINSIIKAAAHIGSVDFSAITGASYKVSVLSNLTDTQISVTQAGITHTLTLAGELPAAFNVIGGAPAPLTPVTLAATSSPYQVSDSDLAISGSSGIDTIAFTAARTNFSLSLSGAKATVIDLSGVLGTDSLLNVERLKFSDGTLAVDIAPGQDAGEVYRLYQAAFARTPDMPGVKYHLNDMESNGLPLWQIASNFLASPEFASKYGSNPTDTQYINALYKNVLNRTPGASEVSWYQNQFNTKAMDHQAALIGFSESPENVALVGSAIANGIWLG